MSALEFIIGIDAFYLLLSKLSLLTELKFPGHGLSLVALNHVLPHLKVLHLSSKCPRVAQSHRSSTEGDILALTVNNNGDCGPAEVVPSIKKLILDKNISFVEMRRSPPASPRLRTFCFRRPKNARDYTL